MPESKELLNIKQASEWATERLGKTVTASNIAYLINYGRVPKIGENGGTLVALKDLTEYYDNQQRETDWRKKLGDDLNWDLAFENYTESQTTKHASQLNYGTDKQKRFDLLD